MKHKRYLKNIKQRKLYNQSELFQKVLKILFLYIKNSIIKLIIQKYFLLIFSSNYYKTTIKNFCVFSGRSRSICRKFKVSRIVFKKLGERGLFFGLQKHSW